MAFNNLRFRFGLKHMLYVMAVIGASLAMWGISGLAVAAIALWVWYCVYWTPFATAKTPSKASTTLTETSVIIVIIGILVAIFLPAMRMGFLGSRVFSCRINLKYIALALHNYHDVYGSFPPAYIADADGKPMHSWRMLITPYLEHTPLYDKYRFDEPWNGPNNSKLAKHFPYSYRCPSHDYSQNDFTTSYLAVVDAKGQWKGGLQYLRQEAGAIVMVIESPTRRVHWMEPRDLPVDEATKMLMDYPGNKDDVHTKDGFFYTTIYGRNAAMLDGRVWTLPPGLSRETATAILNVGDKKESVTENLLGEHGEVRYLEWGNIFRLTLFVVVLALPCLWLGKRRRASSED